MRKFRAVLGIAASLILFGAMAMGSGSESSSVTKVGEVDSTSKNETVTEDIKPAYYVGDVLKTKDIELTYVSSGEYHSDNMFITPKDGNKFIFLEFYCKNVSDSDHSVTSFDFECFADGYACDSSYAGDNTLSATLSSGRAASGFVYFEVPANASDVEIEYKTNWLTDQRIKFIYEGDKQSGFVPETNTSASTSSYHVNDILSTGDMKIKYLSCGEYVSDNMFIQPNNGNHFVYFEFEFENISNSDQHVSSFSFDCFADGMAVKQSYTGGESLDATLSAGRKTKGQVIFEVPMNASVVEAEYVDNYWTSDRIVFLYE